MGQKRALISVFDKRNVAGLAKDLADLGWEIVSSSGTAKHIREGGVPVKEVEDLTGYPHLLGGRVKTLHPSVFGGILARRHFEGDKADVEKYGIPMIDMVVCNLYPFEETLKKGAALDELLENIDIGGVTLIRAAAKNFRHVVPVTDPEDYAAVVEEIRSEGNVTLPTRERLAARAFLKTSYYDAVIHGGLSRSCGREEPFAPLRVLPLSKRLDLRYGENSHQRASLYGNPLEDIPWRLVSGKPLSYNNLLDIDCAMRAMDILHDDCACVIIKHTTPCGIGLSEDAVEAYLKAFDCDPVSAFGGVIAFTREVDLRVARRVAEQFSEVLVAPSFTEEAVGALASERPNLRLLEWDGDHSGGTSLLRTWSGTLVQEDITPPLPDPDSGEWVGEPRGDLWADLLLAWKAAALGKSNSISIVREGMTVGLGRGFTSRVDAVKWACMQAGGKAAGAVLGSDGFFPFPDSIEAAAEAGIAAVIQPGGSIRDSDIRDVAAKLGIACSSAGGEPSATEGVIEP